MTDWRLPLLVLAASVASALLAGCSPSATDLRDDAEARPGVLRVRVDENDGDNDIPFADPPEHVTVWMEGDSSTAEVTAVFDAYDDPIDDGVVSGVEVVLDGPKDVSLSSGEGIHVTAEMIDDLVDAQHDDAVVAYRREAHPVLPGVRVELVPTRFDEVVAAADRYRDVPGIAVVEVISGRLVLIRDAVNEDLRVTTAREDFARRVDARWGLRGATVSGRGPLELVVTAADATPVRRWLRRAGADEAVGRVVVESAGQRGDPGLRSRTGRPMR